MLQVNGIPAPLKRALHRLYKSSVLRLKAHILSPLEFIHTLV